MKTKSNLIVVMLIALMNVNLSAQIGRTYPDGHGGRIFFPFGDISFADEIIKYNSGNPMPSEEDRDPEKALGIPDYDEEKDINFISLGYGGELVVKFTDNILYDIDGYDLFIFEIGGDEAFEVFISKDNTSWINVGKSSGGVTKFDISEFVNKTDIFRYVKLVDLKTDKGEWPGADIDAIGAIGSTINMQFSGSVLFKTGEASLNKDKSELLKTVSKIEETGGEVIIEGYTDNVGKPEDNMLLSQKRAETVKQFFIDSCNINPNIIRTHAFGETNPIADNTTEAGRKQNRRVEIIIFPDSKNTNDVTGVWETNWGDLRIFKYGSKIAGWYTNDYGEIAGTLVDEHTIKGTWAENGSDRTCDNNLYGRNHIGKFIMKFNDDFTEFSTKWGYCSDEPSNSDWNGKRK